MTRWVIRDHEMLHRLPQAVFRHARIVLSPDGLGRERQSDVSAGVLAPLVAAYSRLAPPDDQKRFRAAAEIMGFPLVLKPTDLCAGMFVRRVEDWAALDAAARDLLRSVGRCGVGNAQLSPGSGWRCAGCGRVRVSCARGRCCAGTRRGSGERRAASWRCLCRSARVPDRAVLLLDPGSSRSWGGGAAWREIAAAGRSVARD